MSLDHAKIVLSGIIPERRDLLLTALQHLEPDHFHQEPQRNLFKMLNRYYDVAAHVMPRQALTDLLSNSNVDPAKALLYEALYDELVALHTQDHEFRFSLQRLKEQRSDQLTGEAITAGFEILERGLEVGKQHLKGSQDARQFLYDQLARIDKLYRAEESPEGDMRLETSQLLELYAKKQAGKLPSGIKSGIRQLDEVTGGAQPGDLILICGYTGQGKSQFLTQWLWDAAVEQGKNSFLATSETIRLQVIRRFAARHSRQPQFNCPKGLNVKDIKNGTLTPEHELVYKEVLNDLKTNPTYGKLYIAQVPRGATLSFVESRLARQAQQWHIDIIGIDYLPLLKPTLRRNSEREEFNELLRDSKVLAASFNDGEGVPIISPWAMSQAAYKTASKETGEYALANLADTSEAEKSPDLIIPLLRLPETPKEVQIQILKNRDGETPPKFTVQCDYRCAFLGEEEGDDGVLATSSSGFGAALDSFL